MPPASEARRVQARRAFCVTGVLQPMPGIGLDTFESDLIRFQLIPSTRIHVVLSWVIRADERFQAKWSLS